MATRTGGPTVRGIETAMSSSPIMESVSAASVRQLAGRGTVREYRRGTYLFHQGDEAPEVFFLHEGRVQGSAEMPRNGRGRVTPAGGGSDRRGRRTGNPQPTQRRRQPVGEHGGQHGSQNSQAQRGTVVAHGLGDPGDLAVTNSCTFYPLHTRLL